MTTANEIAETIAASKKLTFTPAKAIKDVLNGGAAPSDGAL
ncbi:hypothetical protein RAD15_22855 [Bradyrhizobium sp. 14AA]